MPPVPIPAAPPPPIPPVLVIPPPPALPPAPPSPEPLVVLVLVGSSTPHSARAHTASWQVVPSTMPVTWAIRWASYPMATEPRNSAPAWLRTKNAYAVIEPDSSYRMPDTSPR
nr:MAG: hypothetical protein DIU78_02680 [Pseudomonadota bacterium]